jgi:nucleotide-binding universal stress UspA family protein
MFNDILVPVDLSERQTSGKVLQMATEFVTKTGGRLHVMTVVPDYGFHYVAQFFPANYEKGMMEEADATLHAFVRSYVPADLPVQHIVAHGSIYKEIVRAAETIGADLIFMASHTPHTSDAVIGPNARTVLRAFKKSVFFVRP